LPKHIKVIKLSNHKWIDRKHHAQGRVGAGNIYSMDGIMIKYTE